MNILFLCTDAYGGQGGIAKFNRDLGNALTESPLSAHVTTLPRVKPVETIGNTPESLNFLPHAAGSKTKYTWEVLRTGWMRGKKFSPAYRDFDLILCGHINLLPVAAIASRLTNTPLWLIIHGIDAWSPPQSVFARYALHAVNRFVSVSEHTLNRFLTWAPLTAGQGHVIPNCIDLKRYGPGPKPEDLLDRYGLRGCTILLTLGRLSSEEQYKGHDEVMEAMPDLISNIPDLAYLICGDGDDRKRLKDKAEKLGIKNRVVFAGYVPEREKADHYRLADAFVMPGRGEGFGIVYLEAVACGVPVVASSADASKEAVRNGKLGTVVDPDDIAEVQDGILQALKSSRSVPPGLSYFSFSNFRERWQNILHNV